MNSARAVHNFTKMQKVLRLAAVLHLSGNIWPEQQYIRNAAVFDYIIVGGGTAGCVIASRLVELPDVQVLLVEAGGYPPLESAYPGYFPYMKRTFADWNVTSQRERSMRFHKHGVAEIPQGRMLGGTSSLNHMVYMRGNYVDFATWATLTNNSAWSYDAILPYFKKSEKMTDDRILRCSEAKALHGTHGKMKVRRYYYKDSEQYLKAFGELGSKFVVDINSREPLGSTHTLFACGRKMRQDTASSFLRHVKDDPKLVIMTNSLVTEILFNDYNDAIGVKILTKENKKIVIKASSEIILTAGAFKTPQLLMLSGIGPKNHLISKKIKVRVDLPVGQNLQDQPVVMSVFKMGFPNPRTGPPNPYTIGFPVLDINVALDARKNYPDFVIRNMILDDPEMFLQFCAVTFSYTNQLCDRLYKGTLGRQIYVAFNHLATPKSRGEVLLSSKNIKDQPNIKLGLYTNLEDLEKHATYLMQFKAILSTKYFSNVGAELVDPKFKHCGMRKKDSLKYWECYALAMVTTSQSYSGTCAMATVVDSSLFVIGVNRLRIADASIIPTVISSPTAATVIMIAEKAAKLIQDDYNPNRVPKGSAPGCPVKEDRIL